MDRVYGGACAFIDGLKCVGGGAFIHEQVRTRISVHSHLFFFQSSHLLISIISVNSSGDMTLNGTEI